MKLSASDLLDPNVPIINEMSYAIQTNNYIMQEIESQLYIIRDFLR